MKRLSFEAGAMLGLMTGLLVVYVTAAVLEAALQVVAP